MRYFTLLGLALLLPLAGCAEPTLQERLAGLSGAEREREAYWACLEKARRTGRSQKRHFRALCDEMHETNSQEDRP
jgi:hypothetical protein